MQRIFNLTILLLCLVQISYSNSYLYVKNIDSLNLPLVKSKFYFFNENILPVTNLGNEDISIVSNSKTISDFTIVNSVPNQINNKKVLIYFDLSLDSTNKEHAIKIITNLLKFNNPKQLEYHLICFDRINYDFRLGEIDSSEFNSIINRQEIEYISNLEKSLEFTSNNPIDYINNLNGDKEILAFTSTPIKLNNEDFIVNRLLNGNIKLSFYSINNIVNENLERIASRTNGFYLTKIDSTEASSKVINANLLQYNYSELSYDIIPICDDFNSNQISMNYYSNSFSFYLSISDNLKPKLTSEPLDKNFANILPGDQDSEEFFIKAENYDVYLYDIQLSNDYGGIFTLFGGIDEINDEPFLLRKGEEYPIQVRFNPTDSALIFTQVLIKSDACIGNKINITGGFPNTPPKRNTLKLSYPDCRDTLYTNDLIDVKWEGVLPRDVVQLEYSLDNGQSWDTLAKNVVNLEYKWKVPNIETDFGLIRVLQLWPNNIGKTLNLNHNQQQLNSSFFSPDGNYIVTSSDDGIVRVWNSNSGDLEGEFRGHSDIVNYAVYSPNGEFIASSGRDGRAIVWHANPNDALFGEIYREYKDHSGWVNSVDFNSKSDRLITTGQDGFYRIYNIINNSKIIEKNENQSTRFAKFSSDNNYYAVGLRNGICKFYSTTDNSFIKEINTSLGGSNQAITHIDISTDSKLISLTNRLTKEVSIWDFNSLSKVKSFYHPPSLKDNYDLLEAPNTSFFYYSNLDTILISSAGNEAIRWDLTKNDGEDSTATFLEHTSYVITADYNFDASRVVTSSWDGFAKIWKLKERDIQMDTSDCNFVILDPKLEVNDFEFNYTLLGKSTDSTFKSILKNVSKSSIVIDSINLRGRDREEFKFKNEYKHIILNPNQELDLEIIFTPNRTGQRIASIEISLPTKTINKDFSGYSYEPNISVLNDVIDFENLETGESKELNSIDLIRNLNSSNLKIDSIKIVELDYENFTYLSDNLQNNFLGSGLDLRSNLQFQTDTIGKFESILKIYFQDEILATKHLILGAGVPPRIDTLKLKIDNQDVVNNQIVKCPIYVEDISELGVVESINGFEITLSFNKTVLEPLFQYTSLYEEGDIKTIKISTNLVNREELTKNSILSELDFRVALGKSTYSDLKINSIVPIGEGKINISWVSGRLNIIDICKEGGERLIDTEGVFELTQNYPNPVISNSIIEIEIIEKGNTKLFVMDGNGNIVKNIIDGNIPVGRYEINVDFTELPNGSYFYILETKNMKDIKRIIINK